MDDQAILEELLALLGQNNVVLRNEPMGGAGGGLCKLKEKRIFYIDTIRSSILKAFISDRKSAIFWKKIDRPIKLNDLPGKLSFDSYSLRT